jgi:hypothetical protein
MGIAAFEFGTVVCPLPFLPMLSNADILLYNVTGK